MEGPPEKEKVRNNGMKQKVNKAFFFFFLINGAHKSKAVALIKTVSSIAFMVSNELCCATN